MTPLGGWYAVALGLVNVLSACGLGACLALLWLLPQRSQALAGVRVVVGTVGLTLAVLLFTDLALDDPHPDWTFTLLRRLPGRLLLSTGMLWFLFTLLRPDSQEPPHGS